MTSEEEYVLGLMALDASRGWNGNPFDNYAQAEEAAVYAAMQMSLENKNAGQGLELSQ